MAEHLEVVNIGDSDLNADWIKTGKGHQREAEIHAALAERLEEKGGAGSGHFGHAGRPGRRGGSASRGVMPQAMVAGHITRTAAMKELGITQGPRMNALIKHGLPSIKEGNRRYIKWPEAKVWHETYIKNGKGRKGITAANKAIGAGDKPVDIPKPPKPPPIGELVNPLKKGAGDVSGIRVFLRDAGLTKAAKESRTVKKTLSVLPQTHLDTIKSVRTVTNAEADAKWGKGWSDTAGAYHYDTGQIGLMVTGVGAGNWKKYNTASVIHEAGHAVHFALQGGGSARIVNALGSFSVRSAARGQINKWYGEVKAGTRKAVSAYAKTNPAEYFAESYKEYVRRSGKMKRTDLGMYNFMRDSVFGGVEYGQ